MAVPQNWESAISRYLATMKAAGAGHSTRAERRRYLQRLQQRCNNLGPWDVSTADISDYLSSLPGRVVPLRAAYAISGFYAWAAQQKFVQQNPAVETAD